MTAGTTVTAANVVEAVTLRPCIAVFVTNVELTMRLANICLIISVYVRFDQMLLTARGRESWWGQT